MKIENKNMLALLVAATALLPITAHAQAGRPIRVVLNGQALTFSGTQPQQFKGSTLVPMRGIFEALGASVKFDKAAQTVYGLKGETAIILPLGALVATVNGEPHTLPLPAQLINGTTLVPLRFISESLGAGVSWNPVTSTVTIQTVDQHVGGLPPPADTGQVSGQVTGVYTNTTPTQLTLMTGGKNTVIPLSGGTIILRSISGEPGSEVPLSEIKSGDQVTVQRGDNGVATIITASFGEVRGTIVGMGRLNGGNYILTLDSGKVIEISPAAPVTFEGRKVRLSDVKIYEKVVIRTNPANNIGYGVAVVTAVTPNPTPPGAVVTGPAQPPVTQPGDGVTVTVDSFTQDAAKPLKAGDLLTATLNGTPGGKASFAIPGVAEEVPMKETSPGVYSGTFTVPKGASVASAAVLGRLVAGGVTSALIQAPGMVMIDSLPPRLTDFGPARGATVESDHPLIFATLTDGAGSGVNPDATRITVDGADVTGDATITGSLFTYRPKSALTGGLHRVAVTLADRAGNAATSEWPFRVSTSKVVQSFTSNELAGRTIGAGSTIELTLKAAAGGKATAGIGALAKSIPLSETDPGIYVGEYTVKTGDTAENAPVTARFVTRDGTEVTTALASGLTIAAGPPPAPKILSPLDADSVDVNTPLTVKGRAAPGSTVRVTINYVSKELGGILPVSGSSGSKDVLVDKNGDWSASEFSLKIRTLFGSSRDTVFTIMATELDADGNPSSDVTKITVRPG